MARDASELARRLARDAEAVYRHYLSNGRRRGRYWTVGDVRNTPGRSMFVRLSGRTQRRQLGYAKQNPGHRLFCPRGAAPAHAASRQRCLSIETSD